MPELTPGLLIKALKPLLVIAQQGEIAANYRTLNTPFPFCETLSA